MVYIKLVHKETGETKKTHYPRLSQAIRAARKRERDWNPYQMWEVEGVYYEDDRLATTEFKKGYLEGLAKLLGGLNV